MAIRAVRCLFLSVYTLWCLLARAKALSLPTGIKTVSRKEFFQLPFVASIAGATVFLGASPAADAVEIEGKLGFTDAQVKEIVKSDVLDRKFLATGDLTRSIYRPTATFTDEIDTYKLDQWVKGTQRLFVGDKCTVRLVGDVDVTPEKIEFRFDEDLMFRIPFTPVVSLTGSIVLSRDEAGYITSYKENWDQDVWSVIKTAKF